MLGCCFPDIRRIDESVKRKDTHLCYDCLDLDFSNMSSFEAGWKFHLYCDMKREEILNRYNFYAIDGTAEMAGLAAKLLEDELVYDSYNNWEKVRLFFNNPPEIGTGLDVSRESFEMWYAIIARYFEERPNDKTMHIFLSKQPSLAADADAIIEAVDKLRGNDKVKDILQRVNQEII